MALKDLSTLDISAPLLLSGAAGTSGQVLQSNGSGNAPTWANAGGGGAQLTATQTFTGTQTFTPAATTGKPVIVKGLASQTANLQDWQNSAATILASVSSAGVLTAAGITTSGTVSGSKVSATGGGNQISLIVGAPASGQNYSALDLTGNGTGQVLSWVDGNGGGGSVNSSSTFYTSGSIYSGSQSLNGRMAVDLVNDGGTVIGLVVQGSNPQSVNLQEWRKSDSTVLASVSATGALSAAGITSTGAISAGSNSISGGTISGSTSISGGSVSGTVFTASSYLNLNNSATTGIQQSGTYRITFANSIIGFGPTPGATGSGASGTLLYINQLTTAPTGNPGTGGYLYVQAGALKYKGSTGTVTTIANA